MTRIHLPTRLECQPGARLRGARHLGHAGFRSALVVVDPGLASTPWPGELKASLEAEGLGVTTFDAIEANPRTTTAEAAARAFRNADCEVLVALGGGSAMDTAKAAAVLAVNPPPARRYAGAQRFETDAVPMMAIPTTCGTGSEVTWVAVLTDVERAVKISIKGISMFPRWAQVDPDLLATLPPRLVAWTGLDALTHAVEAATCRRANPFSQAMAAAAVRRLLTHLPRAFAAIEDEEESREAVAWASTLAGIAFGHADVAAVHCLSESIGGLLDVPHGLANACLLAPVLEALSPEIDAPLASLAEASGVAGGHRGLVRRIQDLTHELELPGLDALGIGPGDVGPIATQAAENGSNASNQRPLRPDDYRRWLEDWLA